MDIALFSDIHGNFEAFRECLRYIDKHPVQKILFLGDYLGEHAYPERTMKLLYKLREQYDCTFIRGNKEEYWLQYWKTGRGFFGETWKERDSTTGALTYTYRRLTERDLEFMDALPIGMEIAIPGHAPFTICHGSPRKSNEHIRDNEAGHWILEHLVGTELICCGHSHIQTKFWHGGKREFNPGAIGVSFGCGGRAQFGILHSDGRSWSEEAVTLDYDKERSIAALYEDGLREAAPGWTRVTEHLARKGTVMHSAVLARAEELTREKEPERSWPDLLEEAWAQACEELLI